MSVKRSERGENASTDASGPPAPDAALDPPTTRSGLVRQTPVATATQGIDADDEIVTGYSQDTSQGLAQSPPEYVQRILRAHTELMGGCKRMSEAYKNVEAIAADAALYRKELEESRKEVNELHKEVANLKELIQSLSVGAPTTSPSTQVGSLGRSWASIALQSSLASSNTWVARAGFGLPAVILDLRSAGEGTKTLVDNPAQAREKIRTALQDETITAKFDVMRVKPTSKTTIKVFVDSEESVANLRRATH